MDTRRAFLQNAVLGATVVVVPKSPLHDPRLARRQALRNHVAPESFQTRLERQNAWIAARPFYAGQFTGRDTAGNIMMITESGSSVTVAVDSSTFIWLNATSGSAQGISPGDKLYVSANATQGGMPIAEKVWVNMGWVKGTVLAVNGAAVTVRTKAGGVLTATVTPATEMPGALPPVGGYAEFLGIKNPGTGNVVSTRVFA